MALILTTVAIAALAAPVFALHYLTRLPEAPACPACRRITTRHELGRATGADRLLGVVSPTQVRQCTGCGWQGRMRWRWAIQREGSGE